MIRLTIDGQTVTVPEGTMIVDAAEKLGIEVPIYCYHQALGPLGACRMCLVQVEKMPKLVTGCTTPVAEGMVVHTKGPAVEKGRRGILEFLLINHPLDCPVCDKGGECHLQDYTFRYGPPAGRFAEAKLERLKDAPVSELILIDQERCVLCQRCVRFLGEYVGEPQLMLKGRGVETVVAPVDDRPVDSRFSGNIIDLCPVGALTSAAYRFKARPWNQERHPSVCPHCPVGCPVTVTAREEHVVRVEGRPIPEHDWGWLCDRGRFGYDFAVAPSRLLSARVAGRVVPEVAAVRHLANLMRTVREQHGAAAIGVVVGGQHSAEDAFYLRHFAESVLGEGVRLAVSQTVKGYLPLALNGTYDDIGVADAVVLLGSDPYRAAPVLHLRLRERWRRDPQLVRWGVGVRPLSRPTLPLRELRVGPQEMAATVAWGLFSQRPEDEGLRLLTESLEGWQPRDPEGARALAATLLDSQHLVLLWDGKEPWMEAVLGVLARLRGEKATRVLPTFGPPNLRGFEWAGIPARWGALEELLQATVRGEVRLLWVLGADLLREIPDYALAAQALERVEHAVFEGLFPPEGSERFELWLPGAGWSEEPGTWANLEGRLRSVAEAVPPPGEARPVKSLLTALARALRQPWTPPEWNPYLGAEGGLLPREGEPTAPARLPRPEPTAGELYVWAEPEVFVGGYPSENLRPRRPSLVGEIHPVDAAAWGIGEDGAELGIERSGRRWTVPVHPSTAAAPGMLILPLGAAEAPANQIGEGPASVIPRVEVERR